MNLSNVITIALAIFIAIIIALGISYYFKVQEKRIFNKGKCIECQVPFQRVGIETNNIRTYYCPKCHTMLAVYFNVDKDIQLNNFKMTEDEDEETVDSTIVT